MSLYVNVLVIVHVHCRILVSVPVCVVHVCVCEHGTCVTVKGVGIAGRKENMKRLCVHFSPPNSMVSIWICLK